MIAISHFKNLVWWTEFWRDQKQSIATELNEENEGSTIMATGLTTGLKPTFGLNTAKNGFNNLKVFLNEVVKKPHQGDFPKLTLQTPEQENKKNLRNPS